MSTYQQRSKKNTLRQVLRYIKSTKVFTALDMSKELKKTLPTINSNLKYLQEKNYILVEGEQVGQVGRPAITWRSNILNFFSIAVEVQLNKLTIAKIKLSGEILIKEEFIIETQENLLEIYQQKIEYFLEKYQLKNDCASIGISVPGPVDFERKKLLYSANMSVRDLDFRELETKLGIEVIVENNANAAILGEFFLDYKVNDMIFISISKQGVGGGQILEQKLQRGVTRKGGEIGHMSIDLYGIPCTCGRRGCLERYVSEQGFLYIAQQHGINNLSVDEICQLSSADYKRIVREYAMYLGKGIQNLICILDPNTIIIGGFVARYWSLFEPLLRDEILLNNNIVDKSNNINIKPASFKDEASLYGVATLPYLHLFYEESVYS